MQKEIEDLIQKVADDTGKPFDVIKAVYYSQFQVLKKSMKEGRVLENNFVNIRLRHLGLFYFNPKMIEIVKNKLIK